MAPSRDIAAEALENLDLGGINPGELKVVLWRKQPVFILHRTPAMIQKSALIDPSTLLDPATPEERVKNPAWLVCFGVCTHLGCIPQLEPTEVPGTGQPGFFCPCHGGKYDSLGRRLAGPPPENLHLLPYAFSGSSALMLGSKTFAGFSEDVRKIGNLPRT